MSPLELLLASLCACTSVTTSRMAEKLRFEWVTRLADLVARYCPVDTLMRPVVPDFDVTWERKRA
jgi:uncharacterized OsmC-like protein